METSRRRHNEMPKNINNEMPKNNPNKMLNKINNKNNKPKNTLTLEEFIDSFFKENHHNFYILKTEVKINELIEQLNTLIKKFGKSLKIPLKIDPRILKLCKSGKDSKEKSGKYLKKYFTNEKKNKFKELYNRTNSLLTNKNGIIMRNLLRISTKKNNSKIAEYLKTDTSSELKKKLISEIRLRKFAIECGFETWGQLKNMFRLFKYIYKNRFEKYFDFAINTNESNTNNSNFTFPNNSNNDKFTSKIFRGLTLRKNANYNNENANDNNENANDNNKKDEWWTYNNPRSRALLRNIRNGSFRISGY